MKAGFVYFAEKALKRFHTDKAFSDWVTAFYVEDLANILNEFENDLTKTKSWADGWRALYAFDKKLKGVRDGYDQQLKRQEAERFMAEIKDQYALFSETPLRILSK